MILTGAEKIEQNSPRRSHKFCDDFEAVLAGQSAFIAGGNEISNSLRMSASVYFLRRGKRASIRRATVNGQAGYIVALSA